MTCNNETKLGEERNPSRFVVPAATALVALMLAIAPVTFGGSGFTFLSAKAATTFDRSSPDRGTADPTSIDKSTNDSADKSSQNSKDVAGHSGDSAASHNSGNASSDGSSHDSGNSGSNGNGSGSNGSSHDGGKGGSGGEGGDH